MSRFPGKWTIVAKDYDGEPVAWCGHWHDTTEEANLCDWRYEENKYLPLVFQHEFDFDPNTCLPCVHELHPGECLRCLSLTCIHLNNPSECERCYEYQRILSEPAEDSDAGNSPGAAAVEESSGTGPE